MEQQLATLKKPNEVEHISREEFEFRVKSIAHAKRDIGWWAENFFRIVSLNTGLGTIKLYQKQKDLLQHLVDNDRSIVLASRQVGKTTCYTVFCMWLATLFSEKKIMICANKLQTAIEIMDRLRIGYEYLPSWIKPGIVVYNKSEITFSNKSSIRAFATSSSASRGFSGQICIIDEMAFIQKNVMDEFFASVMPVVSSAKDSKVVVVSTPNGTSGLYYDLWKQATSKEAQSNKEGWKPFRIDWWEVPGRTEEWKEKQIATIGIRRWNQEFGNEFLSASDTKKMIPDDITERYRMKLAEFKTKKIVPHKQKILAETEDKMFAFDMWHEFDPKRAYLASGDVSEGVGGDASILYIWDVTDLSDIRLCAKFDSNTASLVEFAYVCSKILPLYGNPWLFCERNGVSAGMLDSLRITYKYQNIAAESKNGEPGVYSHVSVKGKACLWARDMMTTQGFGFTLYDKDLIDEFGTFVKKDTKGNYSVFTAAAGAHDDHIMAFIWGCYALQKMVIENYFVVCDTFTSTLGEIYPKILQPLEAYTDSMLKRIKADPLYKQFIEYKDEHKAMYEKMLSQIEKEDANDIFKYNQQDMYFGENDGPSWNMPGNLTSHHVNPSNEMPSFFIN